MEINYQDWEAFTFKGRKFLALTDRSKNVQVYGPGFHSYFGAFFSRASFESYYKAHGETLRVDKVPA